MAKAAKIVAEDKQLCAAKYEEIGTREGLVFAREEQVCTVWPACGVYCLACM